MLVPGLWSMPGGVSAAMILKPEGVSRLPCMMPSAPGWLGSPYSPNVLTVSSPPKVSW